MLQILSMILLLVLTSLYYFPFEIAAIPGANTKMIMAILGLLSFGFLMVKRSSGTALMTIDFFLLSVLAGGVSLASFMAVSYNETYDYTYVSYLISMWVWLGAAYLLINVIDSLLGKISFSLICNLIIYVCTLQCVLALLISRYSIIDEFVMILDPSIKWIKAYGEGRLYGIGCAYDVAGIKFSCALVMNAYMLYKTLQRNVINRLEILGYLLAFFIMTTVGNMIARTTTVGVIVFLLFLIFSVIKNYKDRRTNKRLLFCFSYSFLISVPLIYYYYKTDMVFQEDFRFAFEGFFSLWEKGRWEVKSNEILETMYRFPESLKTWIIGDGYMESAELDPYYVGKLYLGYYMGTDVGYLRFIYYFGLIGLFAFILFFVCVTLSCISKFKEDKILFIMLLVVNFIVWFKVSTDVFPAFALFIVMSSTDKSNNLIK